MRRPFSSQEEHRDDDVDFFLLCTYSPFISHGTMTVHWAKTMEYYLLLNLNFNFKFAQNEIISKLGQDLVQGV